MQLDAIGRCDPIEEWWWQRSKNPPLLTLTVIQCDVCSFLAQMPRSLGTEEGSPSDLKHTASNERRLHLDHVPTLVFTSGMDQWFVLKTSGNFEDALWCTRAYIGKPTARQCGQMLFNLESCHGIKGSDFTPSFPHSMDPRLMKQSFISSPSSRASSCQNSIWKQYLCSIITTNI